MDVAVDARLFGIEPPWRQGSIRVYVGPFHGFEKDAVITADGVDMVMVYGRLQAAPRGSEIGDPLPGPQAAVRPDGRALYRGAGDVVLTAPPVGAADGIEIFIDDGGGQVKARFAQGRGELPFTQAAVGMDGGVFHLGDVAVVVVHAADDISVAGAGGGGQGAAGQAESGLRLPRGQPGNGR